MLVLAAFGMIVRLHLHEHILVTLTFKDWGQTFHCKVTLVR